jgi:excisionase family DNA binding protein
MLTINPDEYITASQAAELLGVSRTLVHFLIRDRDLPARRIGPRCWLIRKIDADRLKEKRATAWRR